MIYVVIILLIISIGLFFLSRNLYKRNKNQTEYIDDLEDFIVATQQKVIEWNGRIRSIDHKGSFESDDEVGFFFEELKKLMGEVKEFIFQKKTYGSEEEQKN